MIRMTAKERKRYRLTVTAYHEAGHAVVAVLNRMPLRDASISVHISDASSGRTRLSATGAISEGFAKGGKLGDREYRQVLRSACFNLAGDIAQHRFAPTARRSDHSWSDLENVSRLFKGIGLSGPKLRAVASEVATKTDLLIDSNWSSVEAVANQLLEKGGLSGTQLRRIVRDTRPGKPR